MNGIPKSKGSKPTARADKVKVDGRGRKVILFMRKSLDGYIGRPDDERMEWITRDADMNGDLIQDLLKDRRHDAPRPRPLPGVRTSLAPDREGSLRAAGTS